VQDILKERIASRFIGRKKEIDLGRRSYYLLMFHEQFQVARVGYSLSVVVAVKEIQVRVIDAGCLRHYRA
jgi:hypothetical protein